MVGTEGSLKTLRQPLKDSAGANMCFHVLEKAVKGRGRHKTSYESEFETILFFKAFHLSEMKSFLNFSMMGKNYSG